MKIYGLKPPTSLVRLLVAHIDEFHRSSTKCIYVVDAHHVEFMHAIYYPISFHE